MKKYILLFSLIFLVLSVNKSFSQCGDALLEICHGKLEDARFIKSWPVQLPARVRGETLPQVSFKLPLTSGNTYKIFACNASEYKGKVIVSIRNQNDDLVVTSYVVEQNRHIPVIMFPVSMSGIYTFSFYFEDGEEGCAVGVVSITD
jgi:hypothetical protein